MKVLVTGATGYIGSRLIPALLCRGHRVRALVRDAEHIRDRTWPDGAEIFVGDLLKPESLGGLFDGIDRSYYLVHTMATGRGFAGRDVQAAKNYARSARTPKVTIYLGGLLPTGPRISSHLASRGEVGAVLRAALPTTEIRAGPVIGPGSAAFELVRSLTERHRILLMPRCASNQVQPIALRDVLCYLLSALEREALGTLEVGGDRLSFADMLTRYAQVRGLDRQVLRLPVSAPRLVAAWASTVSPVPRRVAIPLLRGMLTPVIADTRRARAHFPNVRAMGYNCAVRGALAFGPGAEPPPP